MAYAYSVVRFVPDAARGEYVNVALILANEATQEWVIRPVSHWQRARRFDEHGVLPAVFAWIDGLERQFEAYRSQLNSLFPPDSLWTMDRLRQLSADSQNLVQVTPPSPLVADTLDAAMQLALDTFLVDPEPVHTSRPTRLQVTARVRDVFSQRRALLGNSVTERGLLHADSYTKPCDFAVVEHQRTVLQLVQAWSFQLDDPDNALMQLESWSWGVYAVRRHGGHLTKGSATYTIASDVEVQVVLAEPEREDAGYQEAVALCKQLKVQLVSFDSAEQVGDRAVALVSQSGP